MAQVFKTTDYTIGKLIDDIEIGDIALPDIQRPFVWYRKISKVRDLFDSIYRGYPIGYLLFGKTLIVAITKISVLKKKNEKSHVF